MKLTLSFTLLVCLLLSACGTFEVSLGEPAPTGSSPASSAHLPLPTSTPPPESQPILVAYVQDGNIQLWDEATRQTKTLFASGDVSLVTMSDDGQVIAFVRRSAFDQPDLWEKNALWAVDRSGRNPRELVSAESLRQRLDPSETDSTGFTELEWIPHTHRLVYTASKYYLPGQGSTLSTDLYLVDADTGIDGVMAAGVVPDGTANALEIVPSPDGAQLALLSTFGLSFIDADGSNRRQDVLTYPVVGVGDELLVMATGVWTQDARSFVIVAPAAMDAQYNLSLTIWRVSPEGDSSPEALAAVERTHPLSVTFSPGGERFAYLQSADPEPAVWLIGPLSHNVGPLAIPKFIDLGRQANLHWSPGGKVFTKDLRELCPDAARDSDVCETYFEFGSNIQSLRWIDGARLLVLTGEPPVLSLGRLDGEAIPIVAWSQPEKFQPKKSHSYSAAFAGQ